MTAQRRRRLLLLLLVLASTSLLALAAKAATSEGVSATARRTPVYDPPVLAGQMAVPIWCAAGVYARHGDEIVVTSSGHCSAEGSIAYDPDGKGVAGVFGPVAHEQSCPYPGHTCSASDMDYLIVAADHIPWGHLNEIDMGAGGYRVIPPGTHTLDCPDVNVDDPVETDGRGIYRSGHVVEKGEYLKPAERDPLYFPCIVAANIRVATGDLGGIVLVRGIPAGIAARSFDGWLGFTPLGPGLAELGLTMCDTPNCGLTPP